MEVLAQRREGGGAYLLLFYLQTLHTPSVHPSTGRAGCPKLVEFGRKVTFPPSITSNFLLTWSSLLVWQRRCLKKPRWEHFWTGLRSVMRSAKWAEGGRPLGLRRHPQLIAAALMAINLDYARTLPSIWKRSHVKHVNCSVCSQPLSAWGGKKWFLISKQSTKHDTCHGSQTLLAMLCSCASPHHVSPSPSFKVSRQGSTGSLLLFN